MPERLFPLLLLLAGLGAFGWLWILGAKGDASAGWPSVAGVVLESAIDARPVRGGGDRDGAEEYLARVRYQYQAAGQTHVSANRRFPDPGYGRNPQEAEDIVARYPAGAAVRVWYNPANPAEACLETGQHWTAWAGKAIALVIAGVGLMLVLRG